MSNLASIVTDCRMEQTKVEFALHRMLFNHALRDEVALVKNIGQARAALRTEDRRLRQVERHLRRKLELAGERIGGR